MIEEQPHRPSFFDTEYMEITEEGVEQLRRIAQDPPKPLDFDPFDPQYQVQQPRVEEAER